MNLFWLKNAVKKHVQKLCLICSKSDVRFVSDEKATSRPNLKAAKEVRLSLLWLSRSVQTVNGSGPIFYFHWNEPLAFSMAFANSNSGWWIFGGGTPDVTAGKRGQCNSQSTEL